MEHAIKSASFKLAPLASHRPLTVPILQMLKPRLRGRCQWTRVAMMQNQDRKINLQFQGPGLIPSHRSTLPGTKGVPGAPAKPGRLGPRRLPEGAPSWAAARRRGAPVPPPPPSTCGAHLALPPPGSPRASLPPSSRPSGPGLPLAEDFVPPRAARPARARQEVPPRQRPPALLIGPGGCHLGRRARVGGGGPGSVLDRSWRWFPVPRGWRAGGRPGAAAAAAPDRQ